jgi:hypothetical protein
MRISIPRTPNKSRIFQKPLVYLFAIVSAFWITTNSCKQEYDIMEENLSIEFKNNLEEAIIITFYPRNLYAAGDSILSHGILFYDKERTSDDKYYLFGWSGGTPLYKVFQPETIQPGGNYQIAKLPYAYDACEELFSFHDSIQLHISSMNKRICFAPGYTRHYAFNPYTDCDTNWVKSEAFRKRTGIKRITQAFVISRQSILP